VIGRRRFVYPAVFMVGAALVALWDGPFFASKRVGKFDWAKERFYFQVLLDGIRRYHTIPASFIWFPETLRNYPTITHSLSYWGNPEVVTVSPFLLFSFLDGVVFIKVYLALHLAAALIGCQLLAARRGAAPPWALALFAVGFLNPWLMQHLALGYTPYITYCWIPLMAALLAGAGPLAAPSAALVNALLLYEGGTHIFAWFNGAIAVYALCTLGRPGERARLARVGIFWLGTALAALPKLVSLGQRFRRWRRPIQGSYQTAADVLGLATDTTTPLYQLPQSYNVHHTIFYDSSLYLGWAFLVVLAAALAWAAWRRRSDGLPLLGVAAVYLVLGWGGVWRFLSARLSIMTSEIYPWRFLFITALFASLFLVGELHDFAAHSRARAAVAALALCAIAASFFARNRVFVAAATASDDPLPGFTLERHLDEAARATYDNVDGKRVAVAARITPGEIAVDGAGVRQWVLPWMALQYARDFYLTDAALDPPVDGNLALRPTGRSPRLTARRYHRVPLALVGAGGWVLVGWAFSRRGKRN
jgi:hypothetical protein